MALEYVLTPNCTAPVILLMSTVTVLLEARVAEPPVVVTPMLPEAPPTKTLIELLLALPFALNSGKTWVREDGVEFSGEMVAPWKPWQVLEEAQREYERQLVAEYEAALQEIEEALGV